MSKIFYIHRHRPNPEGIGANHRSYQNFVDLEEYTKPGSLVSLFSRPSGKDLNKNINYYREKLLQRILCFLQANQTGFNPQSLHRKLSRSASRSPSPGQALILDQYSELLSKYPRPGLVFLDHYSFLPIAHWNRENHIPTVYAPQNLDSFDSYAAIHNRSFDPYALTNAWQTELDMISACDQRLFISKLETNLVNGLGFNSTFYPYSPVKEIKEKLFQTRSRRSKSDIIPGLFLMFGSIFHTTTGDSFRWFLNQVKENGLPEGVQLIVGGQDGESLMNEFSNLKGVKIKGYMEQTELDNLMDMVTGVLIPQMKGFGAITRIPEMACAGIPVIASEHALAAIDSPPGVWGAKNDYEAWISAMQSVMKSSKSFQVSEYESWENQQAKPIKAILEKYSNR